MAKFTEDLFDVLDEHCDNAKILDIPNLKEVASCIKVHTIETVESYMHEIAIPSDQEYVPLEHQQGEPAKEYEFILDPFQREAILCIENNQSVLVSAHASAGKTVVAEYAVACSLRDKQRVIYTTPFKALSTQKYKEFCVEHVDIGLITGDVTIHPTASVLIMTTEILRNMLYRGSEIMHKVSWVIFDEIHHIRDKERGVVLEETLILLPDNVRYVFLSTTVPNTRQFAEWVAHLHHQPCHVVSTDYRPTPLQHYISSVGGDNIYLVRDTTGQFKEYNFYYAKQKRHKGGLHAMNSGQTNIFKMVKLIMKKNFAPVIIFSFSKKECEAYARQMAELDLNTLDDLELVEEVFNNAVGILNDEDKKLPQVTNLLSLLRCGIGIHHDGLLPISKEVVEILFGKGLIKALFATETFAMGLNMPARTVLITAPRKFDGKNFRWITSSEYIQMSGRAGRRGLDEKGIVILMIDEQVSPVVGKTIMQGKPDPIISAFHLTYNMILNLLRMGEINPEYMLERSFFQFQNQEIKELCTSFNTMNMDRYDEISSYHDIREELNRLREEFKSNPKYLVPFLQTGRLVKVKNESETFDWGTIVNFKKEEDDTVIVINVLLHLSKESKKGNPIPCRKGEEGKMEVVPVLHNFISQLSSYKVYHPKNLKSPDQRKFVLQSIQASKKLFTGGLPILNPIKKIEVLEKILSTHSLHKDPNVNVLYEQFLHKEELAAQLKQVKEEFKQAKSIHPMDELKYRKRVLRKMAYCTSADIIELKGRVACELNGVDELLMTEMIFNGFFNDLSVPQMVALISCFVCDEKSNEMPKSTEELSGPLRQMQDLARKIAKVSTEANLELDEDSYVDRFKPYLMDVMYAWCKGATFLEICEMTDILEGSIIRCMRHLEKVLRQLCQTAKDIGNTDLENKFSEAIKLIKRDIASLYL